MRIALVVTGGVDPSGRQFVIPALLWLIERLAREHTVTVYALQKDRQPSVYRLLGATVRDLGSPRGLWRQTRALLAALRQDGPFDAVHAYWALPGGLAAAIAGRRLGVPVIVTCDSGEFVARPDIGYGLQWRRRQRWAVALATRLATRVTVCTEYQARLATACGVRDVAIVPLGVPASLFPPGDRAEGPPWRLLQVANLNPVKDQATLLTAIAELERAGVPVHLDLIGVDTMAGQVQQLARELGVERQVTFHGALPTDALVTFYQQTHLAVLSSRHEAAGVVVLEAATAGVPTVGTQVGYVHDWAPAGAAVAVPIADPHALAAAIADLLADRERRRAIAQVARTRTLTHDADWTARQFARLYASPRA